MLRTIQILPRKSKLLDKSMYGLTPKHSVNSFRAKNYRGFTKHEDLPTDQPATSHVKKRPLSEGQVNCAVQRKLLGRLAHSDLTRGA